MKLRSDIQNIQGLIYLVCDDGKIYKALYVTYSLFDTDEVGKGCTLFLIGECAGIVLCFSIPIP